MGAVIHKMLKTCHTRRQGPNEPAWSAWLVQRAGRRGEYATSPSVQASDLAQIQPWIWASCG